MAKGTFLNSNDKKAIKKEQEKSKEWVNTRQFTSPSDFSQLWVSTEAKILTHYLNVVVDIFKNNYKGEKEFKRRQNDILYWTGKTLTSINCDKLDL